jgi:SAM-dependent methyltransferase
LSLQKMVIRTIGFPVTLITGDPLMLDRWLWVKQRLPKIQNASRRALDVGCGTGAFTIGVARRGYKSLGLSWDERNQRIAAERAELCRAPLANFEIHDVRKLDQREDLNGGFDVAVCLECIEHILDDQKLVSDISRCLKPGGILLLTTPNFEYKPISKVDQGPFLPIENGAHVRRGYTPERLTELSRNAGLEVVEIGYCSGYLTQMITKFMRAARKISFALSWALVLPLRILPPVFDGWVTPMLRWPGYSITLVARKPQAS